MIACLCWCLRLSDGAVAKLIFPSPFLFTQVAGAEAAEWVYANPGAVAADRAAQEATWGGLCATGREQSPINIDTHNTFRGPLPAIETHIDASASYVKNTGHGFQVIFSRNPGVVISLAVLSMDSECVLGGPSAQLQCNVTVPLKANALII
eukprot:2480538-Pleurochrysis_carterae.AAC.1